MPYERSGNWYADLRPRKPDGTPTGERIRKRIPKVTTEREAIEAEKRMAMRMLAGLTIEEDPPAPSVSEFTENVYLPYARETLKRPDQREYAIRSFLPFFEGRRIDSLVPFDVERFKASRLKARNKRDSEKPRALSTVIQDMGALSALCKLAVTKGYLKSNPCSSVERPDAPEHRIRFLALDEEDRLLPSLEGEAIYLPSLVRVALWTGMRESEMLNLRRQDVDFEKCWLWVTAPKWPKDKRRSQGMPISTEVRDVLQDLAADGREYFFLSRLGRRPLNETVGHAFRRALKRAKITGFRFHDLRHTFGSRLGQSGVSPYVIARLMGHKDLKMSMIYVHMTGPDERAAASVASRFGHNTARHEAKQPEIVARISGRTS